MLFDKKKIKIPLNVKEKFDKIVMWTAMMYGPGVLCIKIIK